MILTLVQWLQRDEHARGVCGAATGSPATPGESVDRVDGWIFIHDVDHLAHDPIHGLKRGVLVALNGAHHAPVILLREKALGDSNIEVDVQRNGAHQNRQGDRRVVQHLRKRDAVGIDDPGEEALTGAVHPAMFVLLFQEVRAHHGRGGERDHQRYGDGDR